jgi:hypothetical protein
MKKSMLVSTAAILISVASFAQSDFTSKNSRDTLKTSQTVKAYPDGVMMTEGTMKLVKNEVVTPLDAEITMSNGTKVSVSGTIIYKNKTQSMMKEGQHMDMNGVLTETKDLDKK